jgi:hypothetical protein
MNNIENGIDGLDTLVDAIRTMLGASPKGNYADIAARLAGMSTGWIEDSVTWTYNQSVVFSRTGASYTLFPRGTKIRFKQGGDYKYAYIIFISGSLVQTIGDTFANAVITDVAYSYASTPQGFPQWFPWTPTFTGFSAAPTGDHFFTINGSVCTCQVYEVSGTSNATGFTITLPVTPNGYFSSKNVDAINSGARVLNTLMEATSQTAGFYRLDDVGNLWTNSGSKYCRFGISYKI